MTTLASDWNDIGAVIDTFARAMWIGSAWLPGRSAVARRGYAAQHPEKCGTGSACAGL